LPKSLALLLFLIPTSQRKPQVNSILIHRLFDSFMESETQIFQWACRWEYLVLTESEIHSRCRFHFGGNK